MIEKILQELEINYSSDQSDVKNSFGNSHLVASCLKLLSQF